MIAAPPARPQPNRAFTLVELLLSMSILALLMGVLLSITESTRRTWSYTRGKIEQFQEAREAFDAITRRLSQATLNTYWDYHYPNNDTTKPPDKYVRQSELRFISGDNQTLGLGANRPTHGIFFQAPLGFVDSSSTYNGLPALLNVWGYCIEFADDSQMRPPFLASMPVTPALRYRYRLMEMTQPSQNLALYQKEKDAGGNQMYNGRDWYTGPLGTAGAASRPVRVLAENVLALIILPKLSPNDQVAGGYTDSSLAPDYLYDSTGKASDPNLNPNNQLPPVVQVTMVAADEVSYRRLQGSSTSAVDLGLASLFQRTGDTTDATKPGYAQDLQTLQQTLLAKKLTYRVFTTNVSLKTAKWSREQKN